MLCPRGHGACLGDCKPFLLPPFLPQDTLRPRLPGAVGGHTSTDPGYRSALHSHTTAGVQVQRRASCLNESSCQSGHRAPFTHRPLRMRNAQSPQSIGSGIRANRDKKARGRRHHWDPGRELGPCTPGPRRLCPVSGLLSRPRIAQRAFPLKCRERTSQQRQIQPSWAYSTGGNVFCSMVGLLRPGTECYKNNDNYYY